jgi:hypothetical protein
LHNGEFKPTILEIGNVPKKVSKNELKAHTITLDECSKYPTKWKLHHCHPFLCANSCPVANKYWKFSITNLMKFLEKKSPIFF